MMNNFFIFVISLFLVIKGATLSTKYAGALAQSFRLSRYTVGFIIIAIISILPETFISINSALQGVPSFGLGILFGSNIADLTLVFALIILLSERGLKVENKIIKNHITYPFILMLPIIFGLNGHFSRNEGLALIVSGSIFYYLAFKRGENKNPLKTVHNDKIKNSLILLLGMAIMLIGSHFVVTSAGDIASYLKINPILIGMLIVGLGTTMPELFFSFKSIKKHEDSLAVGDILGTVLADATIVVGVLAIINPFYFPIRIIYVTGLFMVIASFVLFKFMGTEKIITRKEAILLFLFWVTFVITEFITSK